MTLFDRYLPEILTPVALYGTVVPCPLTVDLSLAGTFIGGLSKTYDGTDAAYPVFSDLIVNNAPAGFPAFSDFSVSYRNALYAQSDVGNDVDVTISGVTLTGLTASAQTFLANYTLENINTKGEITPKTLEVYTKSLRVYERQMPSIRSNAESDADLRKKLYFNEENAGNEVSSIPFSATTEGSYVLRIDLLTENYVLPAPGYVLIPMEVTATEKARQRIAFPDIDLSSGTEFSLLLNSFFSITVQSVNETSRLDTGLPVACVVNDPDGILIANGNVWTAAKLGTVTFTFTQPGNNYYYAADPVTLIFDVIGQGVTATAPSGGLYYGGKPLPVLTTNILRYKGSALSGNLVPSDESLKAGTNDYTYYFTSDPIVGSRQIDFSIQPSETYYVENGENYERYSGIYSPYEKYYRPSYREATVTPDATIPAATYYENAYVVTSDTVFISGKRYYRAGYETDTNITPSDVIPADIYYEKTEGVFFPTADALFMANKAYYLSSYQPAAVTPGENVTGNYYEFDEENDRYLLTEDTVFGSKTYYVLTYEQAVVESGSNIPSGSSYYERTQDVYALTEDTVFLPSKEYYRIVYSLADVEPDTSISGVFYEIDETVFRLTYDIVFASEKKYYAIEYIPVYFISAGDIADAELYREKSDGDELLPITPGDAFIAGKSYVLATWSEASVIVGDQISENTYFEKNPVDYRVVTEETFIAEKTYYTLQYTPLSVTAGADVTGEIYEYEPRFGIYFRTTDAQYLEGKKYYSAAYVVALSPAGQNLNGQTYYERVPDGYFFTTDEYFESGKTYYARTFTDVMFLSNGNLPAGTYYRAVSHYDKTTDVEFLRDVLYYSVSYLSATVTKGSPIIGEYYEMNGDSYVLSSDRYFSYTKNYYYAVYSAQDTLKKRIIDPYNSYYVKTTGSYAANTVYYRFDGKDFSATNVTVGEPVESDVYLLVTDPEFTEETTYYFVTYPFLGQAKVKIALTAQKPVVTVYTVSTSSSFYGEEIDLYDLIEKVTVNDGTERTLSFEEWTNGFHLKDVLSFELLSATTENEIGAFSFSTLAPGQYLFENNQRETYSENTDFLKMTAEASNDYSFVLAGGTTLHTVSKNNISIRMPDQEKYYGESIPSDETLAAKLIVSGGTSETSAALKQNYVLSVQAYSYSDCGEYPIRILPKKMLAVGSAVASNTYYEKAMDETYFLTADEYFSKEKTYYVVIYREEAVTVGDPIDISRYYILHNGVYIRPSESNFVEGTTYYVQDYEEISIYRGLTIAELEQYYDISLIHGFLTVTPVPLTVSATSLGHDYGDNVADITTEISVTAAHLTDEELSRLQAEVLGDVVAYCEGISSSSDSGEYPITIVYNGSNTNVIVTTRRDCLYPVHYAKLSTQSFIFNDTTVLYDGMLHTITVSYNATLWPDVTITYDKGSFAEIGNYLYTATVSKKNYENLVLQATMSIGTLTIRSSNQVNNAVTIVIADPTCYTGVNGNYSVVLRPVTKEEKIAEVNALIENTETNPYTVKGVYSVLTFLDSTETSLGYSSYNLTIIPSGMKYQKDLVLYGYSHGQFRKLDYTYQNGAYTFTVSANADDGSVNPLSCFAFVEIKEAEKEGVQYRWIFIAIIGAAVLLILGIVFTALTSAGKKRGVSKRRHNRWV